MCTCSSSTGGVFCRLRAPCLRLCCHSHLPIHGEEPTRVTQAAGMSGISSATSENAGSARSSAWPSAERTRSEGPPPRYSRFHCAHKHLPPSATWQLSSGPAAWFGSTHEPREGRTGVGVLLLNQRCPGSIPAESSRDTVAEKVRVSTRAVCSSSRASE